MHWALDSSGEPENNLVSTEHCALQELLLLS